MAITLNDTQKVEPALEQIELRSVPTAVPAYCSLGLSNFSTPGDGRLRLETSQLVFAMKEMAGGSY